MVSVLKKYCEKVSGYYYPFLLSWEVTVAHFKAKVVQELVFCLLSVQSYIF